MRGWLVSFNGLWWLLNYHIAKLQFSFFTTKKYGSFLTSFEVEQHTHFHIISIMALTSAMLTSTSPFTSPSRYSPSPGMRVWQLLVKAQEIAGGTLREDEINYLALYCWVSPALSLWSAWNTRAWAPSPTKRSKSPTNSASPTSTTSSGPIKEPNHAVTD